MALLGRASSSSRWDGWTLTGSSAAGQTDRVREKQQRGRRLSYASLREEDGGGGGGGGGNDVAAHMDGIDDDNGSGDGGLQCFWGSHIIIDSNASCLALVSTNLMRSKVDAGFHVDVERQISRGIGEKSNKSSSTSCHVLSVQ